MTLHFNSYDVVSLVLQGLWVKSKVSKRKDCIDLGIPGLVKQSVQLFAKKDLNIK